VWQRGPGILRAVIVCNANKAGADEAERPPMACSLPARCEDLGMSSFKGSLLRVDDFGALQKGLRPVRSPIHEFAVAGGLMSYDTSVTERAATTRPEML
jgi:hypothetical protein